MLFVNFIKALLSKEGVSSRRFSGLQTLQFVLVLVVVDQLTGFKINIEIFYALLGFILLCFGMTTYTNAKGMMVKPGEMQREQKAKDGEDKLN